MTHLLKYDTNYGRFPGDVAATDDGFVVDGDEVKVFAERDPARLPWKRARRRDRHRVDRLLHRRDEGAARTSTPARRR